MRRLGMIGLTFRRASQEQLAAYTFSEQEREAGVTALHRACGFEESLYLATCNRVEIVFVCQDSVGVAEYRERIFRFFAGRNGGDSAAGDSARALHAYGGEGAAEHLFCVAASLDSMNPGETQIVGQVRDAFRRARETGQIGTRLALVVDQALRVARRVRAETRLGQEGGSMVGLAFSAMEDALDGDARRSRVVLVGAGEMSERCAERFARDPRVEFLFVNRTVERAEDLARKYGGQALSLESFRAEPPECRVLLTSTAAPEPVLGPDALARLAARDKPPLLIDLAIPRDIDREAACRLGFDLHDVDRLAEAARERQASVREEVAEGRIVVDEALEALRWRMVDRELGPLIGALHRKVQETIEAQLPRLEVLEDGEAIARWARSLSQRVAHIPARGLKRLAFEQGVEAVEAFLAGLSDELREDLLRAVEPGHDPLASGSREEIA